MVTSIAPSSFRAEEPAWTPVVDGAPEKEPGTAVVEGTTSPVAELSGVEPSRFMEGLKSTRTANIHPLTYVYRHDALPACQNNAGAAYCAPMREVSSIANRRERLKVILRLLREHRVESQEEMLVLLLDRGISITQATLSRDLKLLKASKVGAGSEGYFYAVPSDDEVRRREELHGQDFMRGYVSIDWNDSLVVIKTFSGHSAPVSLALDNLGLDGVLGTIAGQDNVVFVALRSGYSGEDFLLDLKNRIPELDEN